MKSQKKITESFFPLTATEAKEWYLSNNLTTTGYLLALKRILRPPGIDLIIPNLAKFCKDWSISKSSFYRAIKILSQRGNLDWETVGGIVLRDDTPKCAETKQNFLDNSSSFLEKPSSKLNHPSDLLDTNPSSFLEKPSSKLNHPSSFLDESSSLLDADIYIDRARSSEITEINKENTENVRESHTHACEKNKNLVEQGCTPQVTTLALIKTSFVPETNLKVETESSATAKIEKHFAETLPDAHHENKGAGARQYYEKFGKIPPLNLLQAWAKEDLGETLNAYRKSGRILNFAPNDIDMDFVRHLAHKAKGMNGKGKADPGLEFGIARIRKMENDPSRWQELIFLVSEWQAIQIPNQYGYKPQNLGDALLFEECMRKTDHFFDTTAKQEEEFETKRSGGW